MNGHTRIVRCVSVNEAEERARDTAVMPIVVFVPVRLFPDPTACNVEKVTPRVRGCLET
jgi:hypothetical protein